MNEVDKGFLKGMTGYCLKNAYHKLIDHAEAGLEEYDLKVPEFSILAVVQLNPGITQSKLIDNLYVTRSTASELVEKLVNRKLIIRKAINRKSHGLELTKRGDKLFEEAHKKAERSEQKLNQNFTGKEIKELNSLLLKLADCL